MKQETLKEAAEIWFEKDEFYPDPKQGFIAGAKWQAERMYSYDELRRIAYNAYCLGQLENPTESKYNIWVQQFKNK